MVGGGWWMVDVGDNTTRQYAPGFGKSSAEGISITLRFDGGALSLLLLAFAFASARSRFRSSVRLGGGPHLRWYIFFNYLALCSVATLQV